MDISKRLRPNDPSSYSRPELVKTLDVSLRLHVDFERKIFYGAVDLEVEKVSATEELILDTKDLNIKSIIEKDTGEELNYGMGDPNNKFGSKLTIELPSDKKIVLVTISYETKPEAHGIQWLNPQQTSGKKHPFVFSQFQSIHARTFLPCQDTPLVKTPYKAEMTIPSELIVAMSATCKAKIKDGSVTTYKFEQTFPIPSYLIAFAIGALEVRKIGPRSSVWAEAELIEEATYEFADTEKKIQIAEEICGPYVWGVYDLLVLPPCFFLGGMENPCLTFVTPTLLAGDRSLTDVIAHEIAHSWSGNMVTYANFEHFWLNEGFTVFIERKIVGRLENKQMQDFHAIGGTIELKEEIDVLGVSNPLTCLVTNLTDVHPDDAYSLIPYEKGHTFLRYLEEIVGGPSAFEPFLRNYFDAFKFQTLTTGEFRCFFEQYFADVASLSKVDWNRWLYAPGMPPVIINYDTTLINAVYALKDRWLNWGVDDLPPLNKSDFNTQQMIQFLQLLLQEDAQPIFKLEKFEQRFHLTNVRNAEIKFRWLRLGIKAHWQPVITPAINWINEVGRLKYSRPIYRELYKWEDARELVVSNFKAHKLVMMSISASSIAKDLNLINK